VYEKMPIKIIWSDGGREEGRERGFMKYLVNIHALMYVDLYG
jgi:hypothetical protein